ncbi:hypothetical protein B0H21DRAFT_711635 [Amylocystis lapponica]|nr:hypothetical protein B0H21DRAFT_711635 [Amylocystis lapponica]
MTPHAQQNTFPAPPGPQERQANSRFEVLRRGGSFTEGSNDHDLPACDWWQNLQATLSSPRSEEDAFILEHARRLIGQRDFQLKLMRDCEAVNRAHMSAEKRRVDMEKQEHLYKECVEVEELQEQAQRKAEETEARMDIGEDHVRIEEANKRADEERLNRLHWHTIEKARMEQGERERERAREQRFAEVLEKKERQWREKERETAARHKAEQDQLVQLTRLYAQQIEEERNKAKALAEEIEQLQQWKVRRELAERLRKAREDTRKEDIRRKEQRRKAEEQKRRAEEEQQQARRHEEELRRQRAEEEIRMVAYTRNFFAQYDAKWDLLLHAPQQVPGPLKFSDLPWPVLLETVDLPGLITPELVEQFVFHPLHDSMSGKGPKARVMAQIRHYHSDKFDIALSKVDQNEKGMARIAAEAVTRVLTDVLAKLPTG